MEQRIFKIAVQSVLVDLGWQTSRKSVSFPKPRLIKSSFLPPDNFVKTQENKPATSDRYNPHFCHHLPQYQYEKDFFYLPRIQTSTANG